MRQPCVVFVVAVVAALGAGCASTPAADDPIQLKLNDIDARVTRIYGGTTEIMKEILGRSLGL